ncbi:hypothetical protein ABZ845_04280 [Streptomyces sp. NPDC047022]|uniref:hypothetical protein n=1 Tax=Streptomyces sp. NPDC047022 TaxID=3155737 RepID=UPI0033CB18DA
MKSIDMVTHGSSCPDLPCHRLSYFNLSWLDLGSVPAWVAAFVGAAAAYGALATLGNQRVQLDEQRKFIADQSKVLELQRKELTASAEKRQWEQARRVAFRCSRTWGDERQWWLVSNRSSGWLRDVNVLWFGCYDPGTQVIFTRIIGRRDSESPPPVDLGPLESAEFLSPPGGSKHVQFRADLYFTDEAGQRWHKDSEGGLRPVAENAGFLDAEAPG